MSFPDKERLIEFDLSKTVKDLIKLISNLEQNYYDDEDE